MLRNLLGSGENVDLSEERVPAPPEVQLLGLRDARHQEDALKIWKGIAGFAHLNQFQVTQRLAIIRDAADAIISRESSIPEPSSSDDRRELAHLFRTAAAAIVACTPDLGSAAEWSSALLKHARRLEASFI